MRVKGMSRNILVTGSTDGIGKQSAIELAQKGYHVIVHGRDEDSVQKAVKGVGRKSGRNDIAGFAGEFESLAEVRKLAESLNNEYDKLDVLVNNAGVITKKRSEAADGFEVTFQVNHLAPFLLTHLLMDLLEKGENTRVVNVSSMVHNWGNGLDDLQSRRNFSGTKAYSLSKLCNVLFTYKLAREKSDTGMTSNCLHPGVINTKLLRQNYGSIGSGVREGAANILYAVISPHLENVTGKYLVNQRARQSSAVTYDHKVQDWLWEESMEMVKEFLT
jgi:NAD(P)-dependent dehydrogenase (short-subunit alcohol dehydrogenase family)